MEIRWRRYDDERERNQTCSGLVLEYRHSPEEEWKTVPIVEHPNGGEL